MSLEIYQKKRKFDLPAGKAGKTPEPKGVVKKSKGKELIFVIHEHHATRLHYDLRLEFGGVLASWAVPKEPPKTPGIKRLAMKVEDHPLDYADFEGVIPKGNYGAGEVKIWDKGHFELLPGSAKNPEKGNLEFILKGDKLKGKYILIHTDGKRWLFFKGKE